MIGAFNLTTLRAVAALDADDPGYGVTTAMVAEFLDEDTAKIADTLGWLTGRGYVRRPALPRNRWMVTARGWMELFS